MNRSVAVTLVLVSFLMTACAEQPLQRIVAEHKQQRIHDAFADKPLVYGSGDGVGIYSAEASRTPLTLTEAR